MPPFPFDTLPWRTCFWDFSRPIPPTAAPTTCGTVTAWDRFLPTLLIAAPSTYGTVGQRIATLDIHSTCSVACVSLSIQCTFNMSPSKLASDTPLCTLGHQLVLSQSHKLFVCCFSQVFCMFLSQKFLPLLTEGPQVILASGTEGADEPQHSHTHKKLQATEAIQCTCYH